MPGSGSAFIPTINAITTSQDLQWMVQPTVITSMSSPYSRSHPYSHPLPPLSSVAGHTALQRPGVIKTIGTTVGRRRRDEQVSTAGRMTQGMSAAGVKIPLCARGVPCCLLTASPGPTGRAEVCPLLCVCVRVSQGDARRELEGGFLTASSACGTTSPISIKGFAPQGRAAARFQKQVKLSSRALGFSLSVSAAPGRRKPLSFT